MGKRRGHKQGKGDQKGEAKKKTQKFGIDHICINDVTKENFSGIIRNILYSTNLPYLPLIPHQNGFINLFSFFLFFDFFQNIPLSTSLVSFFYLKRCCHSLPGGENPPENVHILSSPHLPTSPKIQKAKVPRIGPSLVDVREISPLTAHRPGNFHKH